MLLGILSCMSWADGPEATVATCVDQYPGASSAASPQTVDRLSSTDGSVEHVPALASYSQIHVEDQWNWLSGTCSCINSADVVDQISIPVKYMVACHTWTLEDGHVVWSTSLSEEVDSMICDWAG